MIDLDTIWGSKINTSIYVNGLYAPANSLGEVLVAYSAPGLFASEAFPEFSPSKSGSSTKIKFRGKYLAITTRHQLTIQERAYDEFCLRGTSDTSLLTSHAAYFEIDEHIGDLDLVIFDFTEVVSLGRIPSIGWYNLDREFNKSELEKPSMVIGIGYPSYRNVIDYSAEKYSSAPNAIWGAETEPSISGRLAFQPTDKLAYKPDGMSGGPVFGVKLEGHKPAAFFAGIITEASAYKVHFSSRTRISKVLNEHFPKEEHENPS